MAVRFATAEELMAIEGKEIPEVNLLPQLIEIEDLISRTCEFFFKGSLSLNNFPFKGFILEGPPGTGKTEIIKQAARKLDRRLSGGVGRVYLLPVDGASIAAPRWGEAEKTLRSVFKIVERLREKQRGSKLIILFDDVESLMIARGVDLAKEWHYSINSILFHEIDNLDPTNIIVCATTNRPDLVDEALRTRLYRIEVPPLPLDQLMLIVREILDASQIDNGAKNSIEGIILDKLKLIERPTIRDARHITVVECIRNRVWST
jgi:SpoVK/Ycf46/Vps4 family AAA+-type ATPase